MVKINPINNLKEIIIDFIDWYRFSTLKQQTSTMMFSGAFLGAIFGTICRRRRINEGEFSEDFELIGYNIKGFNNSDPGDQEKTNLVDNSNNIKEFEDKWNKLSRLAQKQPGYKYTKFYKAKYMERSPVHYFKVRLWRNKEDMENFRKLEEYQQLKKKLSENAKEIEFLKNSVVIDDSLRREIPYDRFI